MNHLVNYTAEVIIGACMLIGAITLIFLKAGGAKLFKDIKNEKRGITKCPDADCQATVKLVNARYEEVNKGLAVVRHNVNMISKDIGYIKGQVDILVESMVKKDDG